LLLVKFRPNHGLFQDNFGFKEGFEYG